MTFEIVPARIEHMRRAALALRPMDRAEIEGRNCSVRHILHQLYRQSPMSRAALLGGQVAAVWGSYGPLMSDECSPWLFTTPLVEQHKLEFFRETRRQIDEMLLCRRRLSTHVLSSYTQSVRFFALLGFKTGDPVKIGREEFNPMWIERD